MNLRSQKNGLIVLLFNLFLLLGSTGCRPELHSASPDFGPTHGNTRVQFFGKNIKEGATVKINDNDCPVIERTESSITCITPPGFFGFPSIRIENPNGEKSESFYLFNYQTIRPEITLITPNHGMRNQETPIEIYGNHFPQSMSVLIGDTPCRNVQVLSEKRATCRVPEHLPGGSLLNLSIRIQRHNWSLDAPFFDFQRHTFYGSHNFPQVTFQVLSPRTSEHRAPERPQSNPNPRPTPVAGNPGINHPPLQVPNSSFHRAPIINNVSILNPHRENLIPDFFSTFLVFGENFEVGSEVHLLRNGDELTHLSITRWVNSSQLECLVFHLNPHEPFEIFVLNPAPTHLMSSIFPIREDLEEQTERTPPPPEPRPNSRTQRPTTQTQARSFPHPRTEVELLSQGLHQRIQTNQFIDSLEFQGERIHFNSTLNPETQTQHGNSDRYTLLDQAVASELGLQRGVNYTGAQLLEQFEERDSSVWEVLNQAIREGRATKQSGSPDPFALREVSPDQQNQITRIRSEIQSRLRELNREHQTPFYVHPAHLTRPGIAIHTDPEEKDVFLSLLNAILDRREPEFIAQLVKLATFFNEENQAARNEIIEVFSHLYVMQSFPSRGLMVNYFHFLLRCGQISSTNLIFWPW
ncbi:MAG: IPT/TIG domain-containing protein [Bdellovibrionia bacterium]